MILVVGASGALGSRVSTRLLAAGVPVRVVTRDPDRLLALAAAGGEVVRGDLLHDGWMPAALRGVDGVLVASHGLVPPDRRNHPGAVDGRGVRRLIDAAVVAGVPRFVYVSVAGADRGETLFARVKHATERHLAASGLAFAVVRPTVFVENQLLMLLAEPLRRSGKVSFFGPGSTPLNWVSADDVADSVVDALEAAPAGGLVRTVGGPDTLSRLEALGIVEEVLGLRARRSHVPLAMIRVLRSTVGAVHPGMRYLLDLSLSEASPGQLSSPDILDVVGRVPVREAVERWAAGEAT